MICRKPPHSSPLSSILLCSAWALLAISVTNAQNTWDGGGANGNWSTLLNWDDDSTPSNAALTFEGVLQTATNNDLVADLSYAGINFTNDGTAGKTSAFTLAGNSITLGGNITTTASGLTLQDAINLDLILDNNRTITTNTDHNIEISGIISSIGNRGIVKNGPGVLTLSGQNTFTGTTDINAGTVRAGAAAGGQAFGLGLVDLLNGTTLDLNGFDQIIGGLAGPNPSGNITLGTGNLTFGDGSNRTYRGVISGSGKIIYAGTAQLGFGNNSSEAPTHLHTGGTQIDSGLLRIYKDESLGDVNGDLILNGGTLYAVGQFSSPSTRTLVLNDVPGNRVLVQGNGTWTMNGPVTGPGDLTCRYNPNGGVRAYFYNTSNTFEGSLAVERSIEVRLRSLADSASANGNIIFGNFNENQTLTWDSGAPSGLTLNHRQFEFGGDGDARGIIRNNNAANPITINTDLLVSGTGNKTLQLLGVGGSPDPTNNFVGNIGDGSGVVSIFVDINNGEWTLSGTNTHSGGTNLGRGNLIVDTVGGLGSGPFTRSNSGNLILNADQTVSAFFLGTTQQPNGVYTAADFSWLSGVGTLTVGPVTAAPTYWDLNGSTAGAGSTAGDASGTWNADNTFWSTATAGDAATAAWPGGTATFAAGTDATGSYGVTVSGVQDIGGLTFEEGNVTLSGDALRMANNDALVLVNPGLSATVASAITEDASPRALTKIGSGTLELSGNNTFSGDFGVDARGILILSGDNSGAAGDVNITDGYLQAGLANLPAGTVNFNSPANVPAIWMSSGALAADTGAANDVYWQTRGGFAATDSALTVTLDSGTQIDWSAATGGFNGTELQLGSPTSTASVELTNDIDLDTTRLVRLFNNTTSSDDVSILSGDIVESGGSRRFIVTQPGTLWLTGNNTFGRLQIDGTSVVRAVDGVGLPAGAVLYFNNGVYESSGAFARNISDVGGNAYWGSRGGFSAFGGPLTVTLEGGATLDWNATDGGFRGQNPLYFGSETANDVVTMQNNIALNNNRDIQVNDNPNTDADYAVIAGVISNGSGTRNLDKEGNGKLVFEGNNTYTGTTTINGGTLIINGDCTAATGLVDVRGSGRILGGTGTLGGNVTLENNAGLTFDLSTGPGSHDKLDVLGTFNFESNSSLTITSSGGAAPGVYTLVTAGSSPTGSVPATVNLPAGWTADAPVINGNDLQINITSVGAPATPFETWIAGFDFSGIPGADLTPSGDPDNDTRSNFVEFAFGFDPTTADGGGTLTIDGSNIITQVGMPQIYTEPGTGKFFLRYTRRTDFVDADITYTPQFSPRSLVGGSFEDVTDGGSVVGTGTGAGNVPIQAIAVEFPDALPISGRKARFGRVTVSETP